MSIRGAIMIGEQKIQVGLPHARKIAEVTVEDGVALTVPRTTSRDIKRHEASNFD